MRATLLSISLLLAISSSAVELVMRAKDKSSYRASAAEARKGQSVAGMIIDIGPDGMDWGRKVRPPNYVVIRIPDGDAKTMAKYVEPQMDASGTNLIRYREWRYAVTNLAKAQQALFTNSVVDLKSGGMTWDTFKTNLVNARTGLAETDSIR